MTRPSITWSLTVTTLLGHHRQQWVDVLSLLLSKRHGIMGVARKDAESILSRCAMDGQFLVRESETKVCSKVCVL